MNFKTKTPRDEKYLNYIRSMDCCECGYPGPVDAHHIETGGMGIKCSDYLTVALCRPYQRGCHLKADKNPASADKYRPLAERLHQEWESR